MLIFRRFAQPPPRHGAQAIDLFVGQRVAAIPFFSTQMRIRLLQMGDVVAVSGTTAALGMIQDAARSKIPALGCGMPYAAGSTLLVIGGMVAVLPNSNLGS